MIREIAKVFAYLSVGMLLVGCVMGALWTWWCWLYDTFALPMVIHMAVGVLPVLVAGAVAGGVFEYRMKRGRRG